jgi:hypothetical protein
MSQVGPPETAEECSSLYLFVLTSVREEWVIIGVIVEVVPQADSELLEVRK